MSGDNANRRAVQDVLVIQERIIERTRCERDVAVAESARFRAALERLFLCQTTDEMLDVAVRALDRVIDVKTGGWGDATNDSR